VTARNGPNLKFCPVLGGLGSGLLYEALCFAGMNSLFFF
jgi:hypothetical protein